MTNVSDRGIPEVMRTGLVGGAGETNTNTTFIRRVLALAMTMVKRAGLSAAQYAQHAGRAVVVPADVHLALKYHARTLLSEDTASDLDRDVAEMEEVLEEEGEEDSDSESESSGGSSGSSGSSGSEPEPSEPSEWTRSRCECSACAQVHAMEASWDAWTPTDPAEIFLKTHVDAVCPSGP